MRTLILAVVLAIPQASPPIPRQTANGSAHAAAAIKGKSTSSQQQSPPTPAAHKTDSSGPAKTYSSEPHPEDTAHQVGITKLPPVTVNPPKRDLADWAYLAFSGLLVVVGFLQVLLLCWTLRFVRKQTYEMHRQRLVMGSQLSAIRKQVEEMAAQRGVMADQLGAMQRQAAEMERQTDTLKKSVEAANKSADAAKENIELFINKERARLLIDVERLSLNMGPHPIANLVVWYNLSISGQTEASIEESNVALVVTDSPERATHRGLGTIVTGVLRPAAEPIRKSAFSIGTLGGDVPDRDKIIHREQFVHFYGFIRYRDRFERMRIVKFRYRWRVTELTSFSNDDPFGLWEQYGDPEDNSETEVVAENQFRTPPSGRAD